MKLILALLLALGTASAQTAIGAGGSSYTSGPMPTPPSTATYFPDMQASTGHPGTWTLTTGTQACSPSCPSNYGGTATQAYGVSGSVLSGNVSSFTSTTQAANYSYNVLRYVNFKSFTPQSGASTTATLTINVSSVSQGTYVPGGTNQTITINTSATDTTYTVTAIKVYVDGSSTASYTSGSGSAVAAVISGLDDSGPHTFAVKAFNSNGDTTVFSFTESFGRAYATTTNMMVKLDWEPAVGNSVYAHEHDPRIDQGGHHYEFAIQCHSSLASPPNIWRLWDPLNTAWTAPTVTIPCDGTNGAKHTVWMWGTMNTTTHTQVYKELIVDGVGYAINQAFNAATGAGTDLYAYQDQIDQYPSSSGTTTSTMYISNQMGWFW